MDILAAARDRGAENVLIFEDDLEFTPEAVPVLDRALAELRRQSWGMLYLGAMLIRRPSFVSSHLVQLHGSYESHAYAVHRRAFDLILSRTTRARDQPHGGYPDAIDRFYAEQIHPRARCLCVNPMICRQRQGFSDIENRHSDHGLHWAQSASYVRALERARRTVGGRVAMRVRRRAFNLRRRLVWRWGEATWRFMTGRR